MDMMRVDVRERPMYRISSPSRIDIEHDSWTVSLTWSRIGCADAASGLEVRYACPSASTRGRSEKLRPSSDATYPSSDSVYRQRRTAARGMPVFIDSCAMVSGRRCCVKPRTTARPRASVAMKSGSPE